MSSSEVNKVGASSPCGEKTTTVPVPPDSSGMKAFAPGQNNLAESPQVFRFDGKAITNLAACTATTVASLLAIPDAVSLRPGAANPISWAVAVICVWVSAAVLWFAGYLLFMHVVSWVTGALSISSAGIRLWRWGRLITWEEIEAAAVEEQKWFSLFFSIRPPARRLTLYYRKKPQSLSVEAIPSFLFNAAQFDKIFALVARSKFGLILNAYPVLIAESKAMPALANLFKISSVARLALSAVITASLFSLLARRAAVNYNYNQANHLFSSGQYRQAGELYKKTLELDPFFAAAWQNAGGNAFQMGDPGAAQKYWNKALALKPDLVEAKVSLAYLYIEQRQFAEAARQLDKALKLHPDDEAALTNQAYLFLKQGKYTDCTKTARYVLTINARSDMAMSLIAASRLACGQNQAAAVAAERVLSRSKGGPAACFCQLIAGEASLALGNREKARQLFASAASQCPGNARALTDLGIMALAANDDALAQNLLEKAGKLAPKEPWPLLWQSQLYGKNKNFKRAAELLSDALKLPGLDAQATGFAARLSALSGQRQAAYQLARQALSLEGDKSEARIILLKLPGSTRGR